LGALLLRGGEDMRGEGMGKERAMSPPQYLEEVYAYDSGSKQLKDYLTTV